MNTVLRGGVVGLLATIAMSIVIAVGRFTGLLRTPPPKQITHNFARKVGIRHKLPEEGFDALWILAHAAYGFGCGVLYALVRPLAPAPSTLAGLAFGALVWAGSYVGLMPSLGLYPQPKADSAPRQAVMIIAHAVFGLALAGLEPWLLRDKWHGRTPAGYGNTLGRTGFGADSRTTSRVQVRR